MIKICEDLRVKIVSRHEVNAVTMPVKISNTWNDRNSKAVAQNGTRL